MAIVFVVLNPMATRVAMFRMRLSVKPSCAPISSGLSVSSDSVLENHNCFSDVLGGLCMPRVSPEVIFEYFECEKSFEIG